MKESIKKAAKKPVAYEHSKIEKKWQATWSKKKVYKTLTAKDAKVKKKQPFYILDMFPYPSGSGLHVGHPRGYIGSDVLSRMKRMQGFNVLHPMGYDAFGLPAEQYAIEHGIHPRQAVEKNVATFEKQLSIIGLSYDWSRKVNTTDPEYYKWTQEIFLKLYNHYYDAEQKIARPITELVKKFEKENKEWLNVDELAKQEILMQYRLAYEGEAEVNWCEKLGTVLANDEIVDSKDGPVSERGGYPVEKMRIKQWFMRITAYADRLLEGLEKLKWSSHLKEIQKNWIGKSEGSLITFALAEKHGSKHNPKHNPKHDVKSDLQKIEVFTTRADTLFGVTYVVLSPEHSLVKNLLAQNSSHISNHNEVEKYVTDTKKKTAEDRTDTSKEKTGVPLAGVFAINPANNEQVPVWIADYVLADYGTGAVMAVPAHDERDFAFAKKFDLPIQNVINPVVIRSDVVGLTEFKKKEKIVAVVEDGNGNVLTNDWGPELGGRLFIGGTREGDETAEETALREIAEETGYIHCEVIEVGDETMDYKYFAKSKGIAFQATCTFVHLRLLDQIKEEIKLENDELHKFKTEWISVAQAKKEIVDPLHVYAMEKCITRTAYTGEGTLHNSGQFDHLDSVEARKAITTFVGGKLTTKYKMRDAVFARQRYWGEPIPLYRDPKGLIHEVTKLPLVLPNVKSYEPTGKAEGPLAGVSAWTKKGYETNTMPGWAGSSWYFLRYMDPKNKKAIASPEELNYWKHVDVYVGGAEHATGHLLYSRFWNKFLYDIGIAVSGEPFPELHNQGLIMADDGRKMSKRWGNVVNPDEIVKNYGADTLRLYEMFIGPFADSISWSTESIIGSRRFIERVWKLAQKVAAQDSKNTIITPLEAQKVLHKTIKKVSDDIANFNFNTAVSAMMICSNEMEKVEVIALEDFKKYLLILSPFAPHMAEELWVMLGEKKSITLAPWPEYDEMLVVDTVSTIAIQINGKTRGTIDVAKNLAETDIIDMALQHPDVVRHLASREIVKKIYVLNRLINFVVRD